MSATNIDIYLSELEVSKRDIKGAIQAKGVTPTGGLSSYAEAILSIPTGTEMAPLNETITESGVYNYNPIDDGVGGYNSVEINVDIPIPTFETQSKEVTIKKNGTTSIVPDSGYDGLNKVDVTVQVPTGGSDKPQIFNGFAFTGGDVSQVDFSQYDWSAVYDTSEFFRGCTSTGDWSNFEENFNGEVLNGMRMFSPKADSSTDSSGVSSIPNLGNATRLCKDMSYMFSNNRNITDISPVLNWDTSNVINASYMFSGHSNAVAGNIYAPQITDIDLTGFGSSNGYDASYMFKYSPIESIKGVTLTNASYMFQDSKLREVGDINTSNVTNMSGMFYGCSALRSIPQLDTSNVKYMAYMFYRCSNLIELPDFNCVKVTNFGDSSSNSWLYYCNSIEKIGVVDCDSITNIGYFFGNGIRTYLTEFGGCRNLGKASSVSNTNSNYFMNYAPNLTYESVMNVINGLYDRATAGLSVLTLKLHANHLAMLSADDIAIATNKGWTIV
jgi:surface protein